MKSVPGVRLRQMAVVLTMFLGLPATIWAAPARQINGTDSTTSTDSTSTTATPTPVIITPPLFAPAASPVSAFDTAQQAGSVSIGVVTFASARGATPDVRFAFGPKSLNAGIDYSGAQTGVPIRWVLRFQQTDINWGDVIPTASAGHADITLERQDKDYLFIGEFEVAFYDGAREITRSKVEIYDPDGSSGSSTASVSADNSSSSSSDNASSDNSSESSSDNSSESSSDNSSSSSSDNASSDNSSESSSDNSSSDNAS
jgi:hypothetical protein